MDVLYFKDLYTKHRHEETRTQFSPLWHYTSIDGLTGIIQDKPEKHGKLCFWFTRSDCLNDTSEGNHILTLFQNMCSDLLKEGTISQLFYDVVKNVEIPKHQYINYPIPPSEEYTHDSVLDCVPCHAFICSFSLKEDSLDMWRYYSKGNGGYGLKCYPMLFNGYKGYEISDYEENAIFSIIKEYKVIYDNSEKSQILRDIICDTFSAYQNDNSEPDKDKVARNFIKYTLKILQFQFKHECYSSEQEYRFVVYLPYVKPEKLQNKMPTVLYRKQNGMPVPYIELEVENGASYLTEVLISPFIDNDNVETTTNDYLTQCGFDNCRTRKSDLPVRK